MELSVSNWCSIVVMGAFGLSAFMYVVWQQAVRPMRVPRAEITRIADVLSKTYGNAAEEFAVIEEDRAWRYSRNFEQGKWWRVRAELRRRKEPWPTDAPDYPYSAPPGPDKARRVPAASGKPGSSPS
jgi:hypothetical protein